MINYRWIKVDYRPAMTARNVLWSDCWAAIVPLFLIAVLVVGQLTVSASVHAQDTNVSVAAAATLVNINSADAQALQENLKGVGEARAMEIVRYRESYGPFESVEELADVKGIGKSTLDINRNVITLE